VIEETGESWAVDAWHEWETASHGRRQVAWSRGLRELLGIGAEASDDEIAAEEIGTSADDVCLITAAGWRVVCRSPELAAVILSTVEAGGWPALHALLRVEGVEHRQLGGG